LRIAPDADVFVYLWDYVGLIPELVEQMTLVIERRQVAQQESSWVEGLAQVGELFQHAVQNEKAEELKILNRRLKEILGRQPFRINMRLNESARGLRLLGLINAIAWLSDYLTLHAIDPQKVSLIEESVSAIRRLDASLGVLTVAHDQWQTLEEDLRKIEVALETQSDLSELVWSWPSVKKQTSSLCHANTEKWALALTDSMWKLEVALEADNPPLIRRTFPVFRSGAGRRFHQVDHDLKELCDRLREIGESLRVVLKMIQ